MNKVINFIIRHRKHIIITVCSAAAVSFSAAVFSRAYTLRRPPVQTELTELQKKMLENTLDNLYPQRNGTLHPLPYYAEPAELKVKAQAAIAVDTKNGCILYEKNADEIIPPASMTKLFVMYVVFEEIKNGTVSLGDTVPLPPECWACNMPPHSSLMFLGKNQHVTLEELMTGLAVCSGNDAAYAIAYYLYGGMEPFIRRMNAVAAGLGLKNTRFVESSGYSEKNTTTPREMAAFAHHYINSFPQSLYLFHSKLSFTYPQEHNLAPEDKGKPRAQDFSNGLPEHITMGIYQKNTNPLLGTMPGCDGLKTGYIDESGYNLALTAVRKNMRILSVTMKGPGATQKEGDAGRIHDGTEIIEWAFSTFDEYENPLLLRPYSVPLVFSHAQRINLVPAFSPESLCVPRTAAENQESAAKEVKINIVLPKKINGGVKCGDEYGCIEYRIQGHLLQRIPLVAERDCPRANIWLTAADFIAQLVLLL